MGNIAVAMYRLKYASYHASMGGAVGIYSIPIHRTWYV